MSHHPFDSPERPSTACNSRRAGKVCGAPEREDVLRVACGRRGALVWRCSCGVRTRWMGVALGWSSRRSACGRWTSDGREHVRGPRALGAVSVPQSENFRVGN